MFLIGLFKFTPVFLMAGLMISGMNALMAAPLATVWAAIVAVITDKLSFNDIVDSAVENVKEMQLVFIYSTWLLSFLFSLKNKFYKFN
jgi:TRAP-type C4-dicarboxylate transport system permease large subunit